MKKEKKLKDIKLVKVTPKKSLHDEKFQPNVLEKKKLKKEFKFEINNGEKEDFKGITVRSFNHKKEINIMSIDPREIYVADLGYFLKMFAEEMKYERIKINSYKYRLAEDLQLEINPISYDIIIINFKIGYTGISDNEVRALRRKKISSLNKPIYILFVPTPEVKWELRHYNPIGEIVDMYLDKMPSYCYGDTSLREALIMILKENKVLDSKYFIESEKMIKFYGTPEQSEERIEKELFGGKIVGEMEEDGEQIPEDEFVT